MGVRKLSTASIKSNNKSTKFWDGNVGTFESIATVNLISNQETIVFSNIPSTYKHLQVRAIIKTASSGDGMRLRYNSDSGSNYSAHIIYSLGSSSGAAALTSSTIAWAGDATYSGTDASTFAGNVIDILDYSNTNKNKTTIGIAGYDLNGSGEFRFTSSLWMSTSAINSITFYNGSGVGDFQKYTHFALYGIRGV